MYHVVQEKRSPGGRLLQSASRLPSGAQRKPAFSLCGASQERLVVVEKDLVDPEHVIITSLDVVSHDDVEQAAVREREPGCFQKLFGLLHGKAQRDRKSERGSLFSADTPGYF